MSPNLKLIAVSCKNYESLKKYGDFQDSFDDVITKILKKVDSKENTT
jgi:predicted CopG family antitoxin